MLTTRKEKQKKKNTVVQPQKRLQVFRLVVYTELY